MLTWEGTILRGKQANQYRDTLRSSVQTWLNRSRCRLGCGLATRMGPKHRVTWEVQILRGKRQFWWIGALIVKYRHFCRKLCKRLNRSICHFGYGLQWARGCTSSIVFARWCQCALMGGHVAVTCRITLKHPSTAVMPLMANYFDHLLSLDTPTYTVAQTAKRCEPSTVLSAFHTIQPSSLLYNVIFGSLFCVVSGRNFFLSVTTTMTRAKVAGAADEAAAAAAAFVAVIVVVVVEVASGAVAVATREEGKVFLCELYIVLRQYV